MSWNHLPAPAIELIARAIALHSQEGEGDPVRCVLPLVARSWRDALALMPGRYEAVTISTDNLPSPGSGSSGGSSGSSSSALAASYWRSRVVGWFESRAGRVKRLSIRLRWSSERSSCPIGDPDDTLRGVLINCGHSLERLHLEVEGAPLLTARFWRRVPLFAAPKGCCLPRLRELCLCLEGNEMLSQAENTWHAERALLVAARHVTLTCLTIQLRRIRLLELPPELAALPSLHSLELRYDPQMPTLLLPAPGSLSRGLPPSLRQLVLEHPPLRADAAVALADRLSHLLRFDLVWQDAWEIAYL